ncbi:hypothetical protein BBJ28_00010123 [Nothophytophthora sp. Chile5]|nr:hypothetical protein BBJ28_00010123 [Nothophytophthora sp. Chile5]
MADRTQVLRLYKRILALHKQKLEPHMRILGDQYVRDEFKRHKNAAPKFVPLFLREWEQYEALMSQKKDSVSVGKSVARAVGIRVLPFNFLRLLSTKEKELLDDEQRTKLRSLQDAAKKVGKTIA